MSARLLYVFYISFFVFGNALYLECAHAEDKTKLSGEDQKFLKKIIEKCSKSFSVRFDGKYADVPMPGFVPYKIKKKSDFSKAYRYKVLRRVTTKNRTTDKHFKYSKEYFLVPDGQTGGYWRYGPGYVGFYPKAKTVASIVKDTQIEDKPVGDRVPKPDNITPLINYVDQSYKNSLDVIKEMGAKVLYCVSLEKDVVNRGDKLSEVDIQLCNRYLSEFDTILIGLNKAASKCSVVNSSKAFLRDIQTEGKKIHEEFLKTRESYQVKYKESQDSSDLNNIKK